MPNHCTMPIRSPSCVRDSHSVMPGKNASSSGGTSMRSTDSSASPRAGVLGRGDERLAVTEQVADAQHHPGADADGAEAQQRRDRRSARRPRSRSPRPRAFFCGDEQRAHGDEFDRDERRDRDAEHAQAGPPALRRAHPLERPRVRSSRAGAGRPCRRRWRSPLGAAADRRGRARLSSPAVMLYRRRCHSRRDRS